MPLTCEAKQQFKSYLDVGSSMRIVAFTEAVLFKVLESLTRREPDTLCGFYN